MLDLPPVTVVADEYIAANGAADRVSTLPGDFTETAFPQGVDIVVMASNLPQYEPNLIRRVVAKAFDALVPGGEMHLIGETLHDDRAGPLSAALWGLNEAHPEQHRPRPHRIGGERISAGCRLHRCGRPPLRTRRPVADRRPESRNETSGVASARPFDYQPASGPMLPSSRGLGRGPLKAKTRVRIP